MQVNPRGDNGRISKLLEINKLLTKSLDINIVLKTLVEAANDLIKISDTVILYLYDPVENVLKIAEGVGIDISIMKNIAFSPGEALTGKTFKDRKSYLFAHEQNIKENMANMTEENYYYYFQGVYQRQVKSAFSVPLLYQDRCLGVLIVDNFENDGFFTEEDMKVVENIADQSAIAIVNSDLYQDLKEKNEQLEHSMDIHKRFTEIMLNGGGIDTILTQLSRILSTKAFFKETKEFNDNHFSHPIIRGKHILGYIHLDKDISQLQSLDRVAIDQAATALALELVKQNALYEKELHFREEIFQQMLEGLSSGELKQITKHLNWNPAWEVVCMVIEGKSEPLWRAEAIMDKERFVRSIENINKSVCGHSFLFTRAFQTIMVVPLTRKEGTVTKIVDAIEAKWGYKDIIYGIGRNVSIAQLSNSYREALDSVRYGKKVGDEKMISYSNLGVERLWHKVDQTTLDYFVHDKLEPLLAMGQEYMETLQTFIETNKNHKLSAEKLHIHSNTLYYRLRKMEEKLNISLDNGNDWVSLFVAYQIFVAGHKK